MYTVLSLFSKSGYTFNADSILSQTTCKQVEALWFLIDTDANARF